MRNTTHDSLTPSLPHTFSLTTNTLIHTLMLNQTYTISTTSNLLLPHYFTHLIVCQIHSISLEPPALPSAIPRLLVQVTAQHRFFIQMHKIRCRNTHIHLTHSTHDYSTATALTHTVAIGDTVEGTKGTGKAIGFLEK